MTELLPTIEKRIRSGREILFNREDPCILALRELLDGCSRRVAVCWALALAEETVVLLEKKYPQDTRAREALTQTWRWARGEIKMPEAKRAILACHAAARDISSPEDIAHYHAVGQACGTVHANGHATGYPIYDLTALIRRVGIAECEAALQSRMDHYVQLLILQQEIPNSPWAPFLHD